MGRAADTRTKILNVFNNQGDLVSAAVLRYYNPGTNNSSTRVFTSPSYTGYVCKVLENNPMLTSMRKIMDSNPEIKATDKIMLLTYTGTLNTYNAAWVLQSSASTTTRPEPRNGEHQIVTNSIVYDVIVASDVVVGIKGLYQVIVRKVS